MENLTSERKRINLPPVIFGTSALGNLYSALSDETKTEIVRECFANCPKPVVFDSAGKYGAGLALEKLGEILKNLNIPAGDVKISNKLGWLRIPLKGTEPEFEKGVWIGIKNDAIQRIDYEGIFECWEQGNRLLGDIYKPSMLSVHDPDEYLAQAREEHEFKKHFKDILDAYKALSFLKSAGKAETIGVGAKDWKTVRMITDEVDLDWVMFANSFTIYRHPKELLEFMDQLYRRGITIINSAVFQSGFLTGSDFFDYVRIQPDNEEHRAIFEWRELFMSLCRKHEVDPADACVQFAMTPPGVVSISLNTSRPERVKRNIESVYCKIPDNFWREMLSTGLIDNDYPYI